MSSFNGFIPPKDQFKKPNTQQTTKPSFDEQGERDWAAATDGAVVGEPGKVGVSGTGGRYTPRLAQMLGITEKAKEQQAVAADEQAAAEAVGDTAGPDTGEGATGQSVQGMWENIWADYQNSLGNIYAPADAAQSAAARRAAEQNALMGGGLGGGFQAGQAQANLTGQQMRMDIAREHEKQGLQMKLGWLDQLIARAEKSGDRDLQRELQAMADETRLKIASAEFNAPDLMPEPPAPAGSSKGDAPLDWLPGYGMVEKGAELTGKAIMAAAEGMGYNLDEKAVSGGGGMPHKDSEAGKWITDFNSTHARPAANWKRRIDSSVNMGEQTFIDPPGVPVKFHKLTNGNIIMDMNVGNFGIPQAFVVSEEEYMQMRTQAGGGIGIGGVSATVS